MHHEATIETLIKFIKAAIKINNKLYERAMKKRYNNSCNRTDIYIKIHTSYYQDKTEFFKKKNNSYLKTVFLKLNSTQQHKEKNLKLKQDNNQNRDIKMYYLYDKLSYFTKNC